MDAAPTAAVTIPSGALTIPLTADAAYITGNCLPNLCTNVPSATVTWDLSAGGGGGARVAGFADAATATKIKGLGNRVRCADFCNTLYTY